MEMSWAFSLLLMVCVVCGSAIYVFERCMAEMKAADADQDS